MTVPLILLPGMMCDARLFEPQMAALDTVISTPPLLDQCHVADMAEAVLACASERFALAGLSMGGIVAMEVIRRAPARVTHLALMDTNPLAEAPHIAAGRAPQIEKALSGQLRAVMRDEMKPNYLASGPRRDAVLDLVLEMAMDLGPEVFVNQSRALQTRRDQSDTLRSVKVPTLILCGAEDSLCPLKRHRLMAHLVDGSVLRVIEGAGHLPTLEQPDAVTHALVEWLNR